MHPDDDPLSDDAITADFRVYQRVRGHRYSIDDVLTAYVAARRAPHAQRVLDLGSGIGSVAIMLAWTLRDAQLSTIEAQEVSHALQLRNLDRNGLSARVRPVFGDFRDARIRSEAGIDFDLVTGTPPYFPVEATLPSPDAQRAHARVELRGGVEAYLEAAAACVREGGVVVVCADAKKPERVLRTIERLGLSAERELVVSPREGKDALFSVWTLVRRFGCSIRVVVPPGANSRTDVPEGPGTKFRTGALVRGESDVPFTREAFVARTSEGARSEAQREIRAFFGLPIDDDAASPRQRARDVHASATPRGARA